MLNWEKNLKLKRLTDYRISWYETFRFQLFHHLKEQKRIRTTTKAIKRDKKKLGTGALSPNKKTRKVTKIQREIIKVQIKWRAIFEWLIKYF